MPYNYLEHTADIGICAEGASPEEAFSSGAEALFNLVYDLGSIKPKAGAEVRIEAEAPSLELLFVELLNELIALLDTEGLAVKGLSTIEIVEAAGSVSLTGLAVGEPFDPAKHPVKTEVKAATYCGLSYDIKAGVHSFRCVLDL